MGSNVGISCHSKIQQLKAELAEAQSEVVTLRALLQQQQRQQNYEYPPSFGPGVPTPQIRGPLNVHVPGSLEGIFDPLVPTRHPVASAPPFGPDTTFPYPGVPFATTGTAFGTAATGPFEGTGASFGTGAGTDMAFGYPAGQAQNMAFGYPVNPVNIAAGPTPSQPPQATAPNMGWCGTVPNNPLFH